MCLNPGEFVRTGSDSACLLLHPQSRESGRDESIQQAAGTWTDSAENSELIHEPELRIEWLRAYCGDDWFFD
jgi:hypothetical protein